jgi:hypothetical protein
VLRRLVTLLPTIKPLVAVPACWRFLRVIPLAVVSSASETCVHFSCQSFCFVSLIWCNAIADGSVVLKFVRNCLLRSVEFDKSGFGRMTILLCYQVRKRTSLSFFLVTYLNFLAGFSLIRLWMYSCGFFGILMFPSSKMSIAEAKLLWMIQPICHFSYVGIGSPGTTLEGSAFSLLG